MIAHDITSRNAWDPRTGRTTQLPGLGDGYSDAWAVNDRAVAVGNSAVAGNNTATVFGRPRP